MPKPFSELRERLLRAGIAPRHVRRYLNELTDHLSDLRAEEESAGRTRTEAESAALARLGGTQDLAKAMLEQPQFKSWSVRAPWAVFGLAPLLALATAYFLALFILWSGWRLFLPGSDTPFVPVDGLAVLYFQVGRTLYYAAPVLIGWGIGLVAARQRFAVVWPAVGLILIAMLGATARVHAGNAGPGAMGRVTLDFAVGPSTQSLSDALLHALVILTLAAIPYLIWRLRAVRSVSA